MKKIIFRLFFISLMLSQVNIVSAQKKDVPQWPEITQQNKPWTRWWWEGSAVNPKDLSWIMEEYKKAGLGGLEITSIYGVKGHEQEFINFLSPKWMEMLKYTLKEGTRLDLGIDMAQASGWPFGGPWTSDEDASKYVTYKTYSLKEGEKLNEPVIYNQEPLLRTVGQKIDIAQLKEPIASNPNLQLHAFDQVRFPKPLPLQTLIAYSNKGEITDLTSKVDVAGKLNWVAPKGGDWNLYAVFQGWHGKMVERAGPGGEGFAIDHLSKEATLNFLKKFDEAFKGEDIKSLRAFFNDSYEVDDAQGEANWTPKFFEEFNKRRGYDLKRNLPALFGKDTQDKNERVLTDYRETISDLLLENYTETWHTWSQKYGKKIRNQAHGSPSNILDLYAATDIPEIEGEDILRIKFASSAANVTGKPLISSESATWESEHFQSTLGGIKEDMDRFILGGVNHTFYHGANYTPQAEAWPGWLFYAAVHFTPNNPFWDDFSKLNNYMARVQSFMQKGKPANDILLYLPIYDSYAKPSKIMLQHYDGIDHGFKGSSLEECATYLETKGYSFDYISDKQIINTVTNKKQLSTGGVQYKTIVVPEVKYIPLTTIKKLIELADKGATIVFFKNLPADVSGLSNFEKGRADLASLKEAIKFSGQGELKKSTKGTGAILVGDDLGQALTSINVLREGIHEQGLKVIKRKHDNGYYYFIANWSGQSVNDWVPIQTNASSIALFNPMTTQSGYANIRKTANNTLEVFLQIEKGESLILETFDAKAATSSYPYLTPLQPVEVTGEWTINFLKGGPTLPKEIKTKTLASWTEIGDSDAKNFSGTASYTISFKKPTAKADAWILDLGKVCESASVTLNGKLIGTTIGPVFKLEIPTALLLKENKLEIKVSNSMANRIIFMDKNHLEWKKFYNTNMPSRLPANRGKDGLFTSENWDPKLSGLLGPVTIIPVAYKVVNNEMNYNKK